jgi:hypothetical protein
LLVLLLPVRNYESLVFVLRLGLTIVEFQLFSLFSFFRISTKIQLDLLSCCGICASVDDISFRADKAIGFPNQ